MGYMVHGHTVSTNGPEQYSGIDPDIILLSLGVVLEKKLWPRIFFLGWSSDYWSPRGSILKDWNHPIISNTNHDGENYWMNLSFIESIYHHQVYFLVHCNIQYDKIAIYPKSDYI